MHVVIGSTNRKIKFDSSLMFLVKLLLEILLVVRYITSFAFLSKASLVGLFT